MSPRRSSAVIETSTCYANGCSRRSAAIGTCDHGCLLLPDTVEEVWFEVIAVARIGGGGHAGERRRLRSRRSALALGSAWRACGGFGRWRRGGTRRGRRWACVIAADRA